MGPKTKTCFQLQIYICCLMSIIISKNYRIWPYYHLEINDKLQSFRHAVNIVQTASAYGLTSHSTHNRSFRRKVFRLFQGNRLHWYWQPKARKQNTTYSLNTKANRKNAPANRTIYTLIWYNIYNLWSGNRAGAMFTAPEPAQRTGHLQTVLLTV